MGLCGAELVVKLINGISAGDSLGPLLIPLTSPRLALLLSPMPCAWRSKQTAIWLAYSRSRRALAFTPAHLARFDRSADISRRFAINDAAHSHRR